MDRLAIIEQNMRRVAKRVPALPVPEAMLSRLIILLGRALSARVDEVISPYELTDVEFRTLLSLFAAPNGVAGPSDLCAGLAHSPASMTRIGDALVGRGLITRVLSDHDRRRMDIKITPQGEALVLEVLPLMFSYTRELYGEFSDADKTRLLGFLKKLFGQLMPDEAPAGKGDHA